VEEIKGDWTVLDVGPCQLALHRVGKGSRKQCQTGYDC
jgi:hypothetical protein